MTPAVKAFVFELFARLDSLEEKVRKLTPRNWSLPPSTEHPHARRMTLQKNAATCLSNCGGVAPAKAPRQRGATGYASALDSKACSVQRPGSNTTVVLLAK